MKAGDGDKLGEVLRRYTSMRVEDYQRTYSWTNDDIDDFFADLIAASDSSVRSHFFGTLIFQEDSDNPSRVTIVDGQQRVTTVFITIAAIRDAVSVLSEETIPAKSYGMAPERPAEEATKLIVSGVDINFYRYYFFSHCLVYILLNSFSVFFRDCMYLLIDLLFYVSVHSV